MRREHIRWLLAPLAAATLVVAPAGVAAGAEVSGGPVDAVRQSDPAPEPLRLHCRGVSRAGRSAVVCDWSAASSPDLAGYRLVRAGDGDRRVVARTARTHALDTEIRPGVRYRYRVQAVNDAGRIVGQSRVDTAGVPADGA